MRTISVQQLVLVAFSASSPYAHSKITSEDTSQQIRNANIGKIRGLAEEKLCNPDDVVLIDYPQWEAETGYWIGTYNFYGADGDPFVSTSWNYQYRQYRGFITGNAKGNAYRQRNVFLYPPQIPEKCSNETVAPLVVGGGECGVNGNTKVFFADQMATTCSENSALGGKLEGDYLDFFFTTTELIGKDNALLYQVWLKKEIVQAEEDVLFQSQLTTITEGADGSVYRTRTAQNFESFNPSTLGQPVSVSFFRERKVTAEELYRELEEYQEQYNILDSDMCAWMNGDMGGIETSGYEPGFDSCRAHLEQSLDL